MRFNVSRFLVRLRQFWTRDRLVPVLGITALFLFFLNFSNFLSHYLGFSPMYSQHLTTQGFFFNADSFHSDHIRGGNLHYRDGEIRFNKYGDRFMVRSKCWGHGDQHRKYKRRIFRRHTTPDQTFNREDIQSSRDHTLNNRLDSSTESLDSEDFDVEDYEVEIEESITIDEPEFDIRIEVNGEEIQVNRIPSDI